MAARRPPRSKVRRKHPFYADGDIPADHRGNRRCRRCGLMGKPGDVHHPTDEEFPVLPLPAVPREARELDARILGEA